MARALTVLEDRRNLLGDLLKRVLNAGVLALAMFAFFVVPLGKKTALQHMVAIFSTKPAREAGRAAMDTAERAAGDLEVEARKLRAKALAPASSSSAETDAKLAPAPPLP